LLLDNGFSRGDAMYELDPPAILKHWKNRTFENQTIDLDGNSFENCMFINCKIRYAGGQYHLAGGFGRQNVDWEFHNAAVRMLQLLRDLQGEPIFRQLFPKIDQPPSKPV
jgi:hypothetical protein